MRQRTQEPGCSKQAWLQIWLGDLAGGPLSAVVSFSVKGGDKNIPRGCLWFASRSFLPPTKHSAEGVVCTEPSVKTSITNNEVKTMAS